LNKQKLLTMINVTLNLNRTDDGNIIYLLVETDNTVKNFLLGSETKLKRTILNFDKYNLSKKTVRKKLGKEILTKTFGINFEEEIDNLDTMSLYLGI